MYIQLQTAYDDLAKVDVDERRWLLVAGENFGHTSVSPLGGGLVLGHRDPHGLDAHGFGERNGDCNLGVATDYTLLLPILAVRRSLDGEIDRNA